MKKSESIKVGMVSTFPPEECGIGIYSQNLCKDLSKSLRIVKIGAIKSEGADYKIDFHSFKLRTQLKKIIEKECIDVLHIQYTPALFGKLTFNLNFIIALRQNVPIVITLHDAYYSLKHFDLLRAFFYGSLEYMAVKSCKAVIVHTDQQAETLNEKYKTNKVVRIYHGSKSETKQKKKSRDLLFFGRICPDKGPLLAIKAMKFLPEYRLQIAGKFMDSHYESEVRDELKNHNNVDADFGWISEEKKEQYFKRASIMIMPHMERHSQSGILHDAVSIGIPVVTTKSKCVFEVVERYGFGEIVSSFPPEPEDIAKSVEKVFSKYPDYLKDLDSYLKVSEWSVVAQEHLSVYEKVLEKRSD